MITFEQALSLKSGQYLEFEELGIDSKNAISAAADALVITNKTSKLPIVCTKRPIEACLAIGIENPVREVLAVTHLYPRRNNKGKALSKMIDSIRRVEGDPIKVHVIGGFFDRENENKAGITYDSWKKELETLIDVINNSPNVELCTFDVGEKPRPATFAMAYKDDKAVLIRGTADISSYPEFMAMTGHASGTRDAFEQFLKNHPLQDAEQPEIPYNMDEKEIPYVSWDGRNPENQNLSKAIKFQGTRTKNPSAHNKI